MIADNVHKILNSNNLFAKKKFGQNFLMDKNVLNNIIEISNVTKEDTIIEIGPGLGCLTEFLAIHAKKVLCYEIDLDMVNMLKDLLKDYDNVTINYQDFLKADLTNYDTNEKCEHVKVVANLPYYITTPIIFKLLSETKIEQFTFMVQKEVGERLTGKPNTKDYNSLSVAMKYKTDSKIACKVSPNSFYPAPNVDSVLLVVKALKNDCSLNYQANFLKFVQEIFEQRRKTVVNNLNEKYGKNKEELAKILVDNGFSASVRAESLNVDEIEKIYNLVIND